MKQLSRLIQSKSRSIPRPSRRRGRRKTLAVVLVLLMVLTSVRLYGLFNPPSAEAAWFNDAFAFRQPFDFTHNADISDNRAITFSLDTAELIVNNVMESDCDDTRFTDINGLVLTYELTGTCDNAATTYEVVFPTIINGTNPAFVYYGNVSALSASAETSGYTALTPSGGDPSITTRTNEEKGPGPVVYFKFDEGVDNTCSGGTNDACDETSFANDGDIGGGTAWQTEDMCVSGKCLFFDGIDDDVTITNNPSIDHDRLIGDALTYQAWVRVNSDGGGDTGQIVNKRDYLRITNEGTDGLADLEASMDLATDATLTIVNGITLNRWHHVAMTYTDDADDELTVYLDGISQGSSTDGVGGPVADVVELNVGGRAPNYFHGFIDEFKLYDKERTAAEIKTDFIAGSSALHGTSAAFGILDYSYLSDGLVGYWKLDEASADTCTGGSNDSCDSSGNGNDGAWNFQANSAAGKFGNAVTLDGTDDDVGIADDADLDITGDITVAAWVNADTVTGFYRVIAKMPVGENTGYMLDVHDSDLRLRINSTDCESTSNPLSIDTWYHVAGTYDLSNIRVYVDGVEILTCSSSAAITANNEELTIGNRSDNNSPFNGEIDEARVYNRTFTPSEISDLYNWGPGPVGYWNFDEGTGTTTVNDRSTNANNGTMNGSMTESDWVPGQFGSALDFDGSNDNIGLSSPTVLDNLPAISASSWIYPRSNGANSNGRIIDKANTVGGDAGWLFSLNSSSQLRFLVDYDNGTNTDLERITTDTVTFDQWQHVAVTWTGSATATNVHIYINGVETAYGTTTNGDQDRADDSGSNMTIGDVNGATARNFDGYIDDVRVYDYVRTSSQIIEDMNAGHPAPGSPVGSPVAHWQMDEGYGTTAQDKTDNDNDLTLSTSSWTLSGKFDKAWNGTGALWLARADDSDFDFGSSVDFSLSMWVKSDSATNPSATEVLMNKHVATNNPGYRLSFNTSGQLVCEIDDDTTSFPEDTASSTTDYYDANWHHVVCIRDITGDDLNLYVDGLFVDDDGNLDATGDMSNADNLSIGDEDESDDGDEFFGDIDEVKVYRLALTAAQIKGDMNKGSAASFGDVANQDNEGFSGNAPSAWWNFNENTGTTANDISGNSNTGTLNGGPSYVPVSGAPSYVNGLAGSALDSDGSDDRVNVTSSSEINSLINMTISAWVYTRSAGGGGFGRIIRKGNTGAPSGTNMYWDLHITNSSANSFTFRVGCDPNDGRWNSTNTFTLQDTWVHFALTYTHCGGGDPTFYVNGVQEPTTEVATPSTTSDTDDTTLAIGDWGTGTRSFDGLIDDVRVYDYALSQAQISYLYSRGYPLSYWKLDECSGTTANDSGSGGYNGTITPGASTHTTVGSCGSGSASEMWDDGQTGKRNFSLDFDGGDDYVDMNDVHDVPDGIDTSVAGWFNRETFTTDDTIVAKKNDQLNSSAGYIVWIDDATDDLRLFVSDGDSTNDHTVDSTSTFTSTGWNHFVIVYDDSSSTASKIYINGQDDNAGNTTTGTFTSINNLSNAVDYRIGSESDGGEPFAGELDDIQVYNYKLTADLVKRIYNHGAQFFGPATGSP